MSIDQTMIRKLNSIIAYRVFFFFKKKIIKNWDSLHARLNIHIPGMELQQKKHKKKKKRLQDTENLFRKYLQLKDIC